MYSIYWHFYLIYLFFTIYLLSLIYTKTKKNVNKIKLKILLAYQNEIIL